MVPNLRFPYKGDWHKRKLNEICLFFKGNGLSKSDLSNEGFPCILYGELYTTYKNEVISDIVSKTTTTLSNPFLSKNNDLIIPGSGEDPIDIAVARAIYQNDIILGGDLNVLRPKSNVSAAFLSYQLNGVRRYDIAKKAQGKSIVHLHNSDLKEVCVSIPTYDEQLHIVKLLTKIDEMIETQIKIIADCLSYRNAIVDYFFESLSSNWRQVKLSNILKEYSELHVKDNSIIHATLSKEGIYPKTDRYDRDFLVKDEEKKYKVSHLNDICYNPANLKFGVITRNTFGDCIISPIYITFTINNNYLPKFVELLVTRKQFITQARKYEQGTVYERMAVNSSDLLSMNVFIPSLSIQQKIVDIVDIIDNKINNEKELLNLYKMQKDYLLKNMFI